MNWYKTIPKYQESVNEPGIFNSYALLNAGNNNVWFFYNDNAKNFDAKNNRQMVSMRTPARSVMAGVSVNANGQLSKSFLYKSKEKKVIAIPQSFYQLGNGEIIMKGVYRKRVRLGKISID